MIFIGYTNQHLLRPEKIGKLLGHSYQISHISLPANYGSGSWPTLSSKFAHIMTYSIALPSFTLLFHYDFWSDTGVRARIELILNILKYRRYAHEGFTLYFPLCHPPAKNTNGELLELRHEARRLAGCCCHFISLFTPRRCAAAAASLKGRLAARSAQRQPRWAIFSVCRLRELDPTGT